MIGAFVQIGIAFVSNCHNDAVARFHFLDVVEDFLVSLMRVGRIRIVTGEKHDRQVLIDQRIGTVFHFARGIAFRMNIGQLLQFQRPFESDREMNAARQEQKVSLAEKALRNVFDVFHVLENALHLVRQLGQIRETFADV